MVGLPAYEQTELKGTAQCHTRCGLSLTSYSFTTTHEKHGCLISVVKLL